MSIAARLQESFTQRQTRRRSSIANGVLLSLQAVGFFIAADLIGTAAQAQTCLTWIGPSSYGPVAPSYSCVIMGREAIVYYTPDIGPGYGVYSTSGTHGDAPTQITDSCGVATEYNGNPVGGQAFRADICPAPQYWVSATLPPNSQTKSGDAVGDPINPAIGNVYTTETDVQFAGGDAAIAFRRFYNSADTLGMDGVPGWRHSYDRHITTMYAPIGSLYPGQSSSVSAEFTTPTAACTQGFPSIQGAVSAWAGATATYSNGLCVLSKASTTIGTLVIQANETFSPPPNPIEYDLIRDDGQTLRYPVAGSVINNPPGISIRLTASGSGFTVTDDQDNVEIYSAAGVLQSITSRTGIVQTISYDSGGLFHEVLDSFGNSLIVTRNAQGSIGSIALSGGGSVQYGYYHTLLTSVINLDSTSRTYVYGDSRFSTALTSIKDENNVTYSSWGYDAQERGTSSQLAGAVNATTLLYNADGSVKTTDALGANRTFQYSRVGDMNRVTSISGSQCPTCSESAATTYDSAGWISRPHRLQR